MSPELSSQTVNVGFESFVEDQDNYRDVLAKIISTEYARQITAPEFVLNAIATIQSSAIETHTGPTLHKVIQDIADYNMSEEYFLANDISSGRAHARTIYQIAFLRSHGYLNRMGHEISNKGHGVLEEIRISSKD
jgi:hypothetical protein